MSFDIWRILWTSMPSASTKICGDCNTELDEQNCVTNRSIDLAFYRESCLLNSRCKYVCMKCAYRYSADTGYCTKIKYCWGYVIVYGKECIDYEIKLYHKDKRKSKKKL